MDKIERAAGGKRKRRTIGIDLGLSDLLILSNGVRIGHHPSIPRLKHNLNHFIKRLEGQVVGSRRWYETLRIIDKTRAQLENCQQDHANKIAVTLCKHYKVICIEAPTKSDHINQRVENEIFIANWDMVRAAIKKKSIETHVAYVEVSPYYTSSTCMRCGNRQKLEIHERTYTCPNCLLSIDRDVNAANNIRRKGMEKLNKQRKIADKIRDVPF